MALKIDGVSAFFTKITTAFNNSTVLKEGGSVVISNVARTDISGTITTGGVAQTLSTLTLQGYFIFNPDVVDLWISDSTTAAPNGTGSILITANGGWYETPDGYKHTGNISIYGSTTGQKFTAKKY